MPLCETDGLLLCLEDMQGEIAVCDDGLSAWVPAGWPIHRLTPALWELGLSMANQGDIDRQSIAGALSTGTHGTGVTLGSISTQALAFGLVTSDGSLAVCDAETDPDLFQAARLGLGMVGVMERVKLALKPAYRLRETLRRAPLDEILSDWDALAAAHRHVEFFVFPYADQALVKILDPVDSGDDTPATDLENAAVQFISDAAAAAPFLAPTLQRLITRLMSPSTRAAPAHRIFPSERTTLFEEMEYEIPAAAGPDALRAAIAEVRRRKFPIIFPLEFPHPWRRTTSMALAHARRPVPISISFHQYARMDWKTPCSPPSNPSLPPRRAGVTHFKAERLTALTSADVPKLYPMTASWAEVRRRVDPSAKFMNASLRDLFAFSL